MSYYTSIAKWMFFVLASFRVSEYVLAYSADKAISDRNFKTSLIITLLVVFHSVSHCLDCANFTNFYSSFYLGNVNLQPSIEKQPEMRCM